MVDEQVYRDYPCKICKRLNYFVSGVDSRRVWVCTECQMIIGDDSMDRWGDMKKKLVGKGVKLRIGMSLIFRGEGR